VNEPRDPFAVNPVNAADVLMVAWGDFADEIRADSGKWVAHIKGTPAGELITADGPDALNQALRAEWQRRGGDR
jgi:hypothetical protein